MKSIRNELGNRILFFDGGTGTVLQSLGLGAGELPEMWNLTRPEEIVRLHRDYLEAGCDIIKTNTFGANSLKFPVGGALEEVIRAALEHAKTARIQAGREDSAWIALDVGPTGRLLKPMGDLDFEDAVEIFARIVSLGEKYGADLVLIETMSDSYEAKAALLAAKENTELPVFVTMIFGENGKLLTGGDVPAAVATLEGLGADAIGINCGLGPVQMKGIVKEMLEISSLPVIVNPNAGLPRSENGVTVFDVGPEEFADHMEEIALMGAQVLGGCCGTAPEYLRRVTERCRKIPAGPVTDKNRTVISSYAQAVVFGGRPVIIGERINPTGKKRLKEALKNHDMEYLLEEGLNQVDSGAHVLDVNVGLPGIDEAATMTEAVQEIQGIIDLPLQIDTSDVRAMEQALRVYNGKAMVNSVNGKQEVMEQVFPLVRKYGGVVVGLALDESGIPETAGGRIAIAEKIYRTAASYGISPKDIVIDGLAMTISSDHRSALVTLETIRRIRDELGGKSILGVSNISFGLPKRENINSLFFGLAMQNGLSAAIINPNAEAMMRAYDSYCALAGLDEQCLHYVEKYSLQQEEKQPVWQETASLSRCIAKGLKDQAAAQTRQLLETRQPLDLINQELVPALDVVGQGFEKGTVFLPQLLMSADAAKASFEVIKNFLLQKGTEEEKKGTVILATVKGDIHDIGKNIVRVLLENYGYEVIDLGKDVEPEKIVNTAVEKQVALVGLSALMTTTVVNMEETIRQLRKAAPWCRIMVGGAVLTEEYAASIGADFYGKDAMASVRYAENLFSETGAEPRDRQTAINKMVHEISGILSDSDPSIYLYGSSVLNDFKLGWSDIDILVLTEKQITEEQAQMLAGLRQDMLEKEPGNPYYRSFEGGMLTLDAFLSKKADRVVYWGTSGQRITDSYVFDSFSMAELIESGVLLFGKDITSRLKLPSYDELYADVKNYYEIIRKYVQKTDRSFYSFGWMLDISRCIYTLRTGKIIPKTEAAKWALENNLCTDPEVLKTALRVRRNPLEYKDDEQTFDYAETLAEPVQRYADVLEKELVKKWN